MRMVDTIIMDMVITVLGLADQAYMLAKLEVYTMAPAALLCNVVILMAVWLRGFVIN